MKKRLIAMSKMITDYRIDTNMELKLLDREQNLNINNLLTYGGDNVQTYNAIYSTFFYNLKQDKIYLFVAEFFAYKNNITGVVITPLTKNGVSDIHFTEKISANFKQVTKQKYFNIDGISCIAIPNCTEVEQAREWLQNKYKDFQNFSSIDNPNEKW